MDILLSNNYKLESAIHILNNIHFNITNMYISNCSANFMPTGIFIQKNNDYMNFIDSIYYQYTPELHYSTISNSIFK